MLTNVKNKNREAKVR